MSKEDEFKARAIADVSYMAIQTGGVYTSGELGPNGITRETAPSAFDANGWLKPCTLFKQRGEIPTGDIEDYTDQTTSTRQIVEAWHYQEQGSYAAIDAAIAREYELFQGYPASDGFEIRLANVLDRQRDTGSLMNASLARLDWQVDLVME